MKIYIVTVIDNCGSIHVQELFSNEKNALEYEGEMAKMYDLSVGWTITYSIKEIDVENIGLTGLKEHYDKIHDPVWREKWNTRN